MTQTNNTQRIAELNDLCRKAMGVGGRLIQTAGVNALPAATQSKIREKVETFDAFDAGNDPYGEHDFGTVYHHGAKLFWKIDYYDPTMQYRSDDPADPSKTVRVLTIMLASEY